MIVQCEKCQAKFRLEDDRVPEEGIKGKCSRCGHIFFIEKSGASIRESQAIEERGEEDATSFDLTHWSSSFRQNRYLMAGLLSVLIFMVLIGFTWLFFDTFPHIREKVFTQANIRRYFQDDGPLKKDVVFSTSKTRGYYIDNKKIGRIFVIEGEAINNSAQLKDFIQVKGTLFDNAGNKVAEKEVYCGSILSEKELAEFDVEQIRIRLGYDAEKPRSPLNLHPQASIRFMIVFFDLPKDLKEFGVESTGKIEEVE